MKYVSALIAFWHSLPLPVTAAAWALVSFVGGDLLTYLNTTKPELLTWQGVGSAIIAGLVAWGEGYLRLIQTAPEK